MKINPISQYNRTFGSGLNNIQRQFIADIDPSKVQELFRTQGVKANFKNNKLAAALCQKSAEIAKMLNLKLPTFIDVTTPSIFDIDWYNFKPGQIPRQVKGRTRLFYGPRSGNYTQVELNQRFLNKGAQEVDKISDSFAQTQGTTHILTVPIHELIHADHFQRGIFGGTLNEIKKINLEKYKDEIKTKIGDYATKNPLELYAVYLTKEICNSLDENWTPRYNPIQDPKIQLSGDLREFIHEISHAKLNKGQKLLGA